MSEPKMSPFWEGPFSADKGDLKDRAHNVLIYGLGHDTAEYFAHILNEKGKDKALIKCLRAHLTKVSANWSEEEKKSEALKAGFMKVKKENDEGIELMQEAKRLITALARAIAVLAPYSPTEARAECECIVGNAIRARDLL